AARWAANGVLLRLPLKPTVPAEAKQSTSPLVSVIVTMVLLNVALMWATPRLTLRRAFRFLLLATEIVLLIHRVLTAQFLHTLLARHSLPRSLARAGVRLGALAAHRQAATMAQAPVTTNVAQAGDILLHLAAQRAFHRVLTVENAGQAADVVV